MGATIRAAGTEFNERPGDNNLKAGIDAHSGSVLVQSAIRPTAAERSVSAAKCGLD